MFPPREREGIRGSSQLNLMAVAIEKNLSRNKNTEAPFGRRDYQLVGKTEVLFGKADWPPGIARLSEAAQRVEIAARPIKTEVLFGKADWAAAL